MKISIVIVSPDSELTSELSRIVEAHYPSRLLFSYKSIEDMKSSFELNKPVIVFVHDVLYQEAKEPDEFLRNLNEGRRYPVLILTRIDYSSVAKSISRGIDDFLYMSQNEQLITARIRTILHAYSEKLRLSESVGVDDWVGMLQAAISTRLPGANERLSLIHDMADWLFVNAEGESEEGRKELAIASKLAFLGRLGLSDELLHETVSKDGFANGDLMYQIPHAAYSILSRDKKAVKAGEILKHIYENMDGSGFPDRLESWQIPIESRILRIAMALEERLHNGLEPQEAYGQIQRLATRVYDKRIVSLLPEYINQFLDTLKPSEMTVSVMQLVPGMVLTRDIITYQGLKLLPEGKTLDQHTIKIIVSHTKNDPINGHIYVKKNFFT